MLQAHLSTSHAEQKMANFQVGALARDPWLERVGWKITLGFTALFVLFIVIMVMAGHVPGHSAVLKSVDDIIQIIGELIALFFCGRITLRLTRVFRLQRTEITAQDGESQQRSELRATRRACVAWGLLALGIATYALGQFLWTWFDVQMPSSAVPFPDIYDLGYVGAYPFFLVGTLLLTRRGHTTIGRTRLVLDALAVIGVAFALSWFFVLGPTLTNLSGSVAAKTLAIYFPAGDLFLVALGALLMFSPLSSPQQQPVLWRLFLGLCCLAVTDSLLGYFNLSPSGFNTGTLQDPLWPLSMLFIGLAAIEYPRCIAREQNTLQPRSQSAVAGTLSLPQLAPTLQTIAPFLLALGTCAILLTTVASRGGATLIQSTMMALGLIVIVSVRQGLTLLENNRLRMQLHGDLQESQQELQVKQHEALTDAVTGLPNHRAFMSTLNTALSLRQQTQRDCTVVFLDLDHFKNINDTWGHRAGDMILREVGQRLREAVPDDCLVCRYGGEEFAIVLTGMEPPLAEQIAERLRTTIAALPYLWVVEDGSATISIAMTGSFGVSVSGEHGTTREALIEAADRAMYEAKRSGRNRVCRASSEQESSSQDDWKDDRSASSSEVTIQRTLLAVATLHDRATAAHAERLLHLVTATARQLGQPEEEQRLIGLAAQLHDIGKIGIPDAILQKPGALDAEEWAVMRRHPEIGAALLTQIGGVFGEVAQQVLAHHERWDGKGYPHQNFQEDIPLGARILTVVDAYDAMISQRVYKPARSSEDARAELQRCAGFQFDPVVVEAFLLVLEREAALGAEEQDAASHALTLV